jgi:hypothetical protein
VHYPISSGRVDKHRSQRSGQATGGPWLDGRPWVKSGDLFLEFISHAGDSPPASVDHLRATSTMRWALYVTVPHSNV